MTKLATLEIKSTVNTDLDANDALDLQPIGTRIIVQTPLGKGKVGRIILPKSAMSQEITEGIVLAVGESCERIEEGQNVYYGQYAGIIIDRNGEKFVLMDEADVLCFITDKKKGLN
jgi:co-chaperonin GroES (HSP10)